MDTNTNLESFLNATFTDAIEHGIRYWANVEEYKWADANGEPDLSGYRASIRENEGGRTYAVNRGVMAQGVRLIAAGFVPVNSHLRNACERALAGDEEVDIDASDADAIVQAGLFAEVIYG